MLFRSRAPLPGQDGVRLHVINRATGRARIWGLPLVFFSYYICNAFDTEGAATGGWGEVHDEICSAVDTVLSTFRDIECGLFLSFGHLGNDTPTRRPG